MQFTTAISALVAVAGLASAATPSYGIEMVPVPEGYFESHLGETGVTLSPAVAVQRRLSSRAITHVYVCINSNFSGACQNVQVNTGGCYNFVGNYNDAISSIGPDQVMLDAVAAVLAGSSTPAFTISMTTTSMTLQALSGATSGLERD
ncbi:uncharacterized protein RCO7_03865 [Rhynchosporium graminicola]|uniref:Uncharacterized protein n=1 Tax=Rhynchosporium graminicola TaxID=2792576 RepID=A0A1E1LLS3_9HELO|nr:uncharacterized protein RCO7_03865 [Rhynchosporium commune]